MTTQFLSRVERIDKNTIPLDRNCTSGPGSYNLPCGIKYEKAGFAPFTTTGQRSKLVVNDAIPPPGSYNLAKGLITKDATAATAFKSKTDRFAVKNNSFVPQNVHPLERELNGDGENNNYNSNNKNNNNKNNNDGILKTSKSSSGLDTGHLTSTKRSSKSSPEHGGAGRRGVSNMTRNSSLDILKEILPTAAAPPSMPNRFQSFGYQQDEETGKLIAQQPFGIITGIKDDQIGPGQYNVAGNLAHGKSVNFGKGAKRQLDVAKYESVAPGTYNIYSNFDLISIGKTGRAVAVDKENEVYFKMFQDKTKLKSASFTSNVVREAFPDTSIGPGPGNYALPTAIQLQKVYQEVPIGGDAPRFQSFERAARDCGPSPWTYNPLTSDFDKDKIKILKDKKIRSRSGWAQNVSFATTTGRPWSQENTYTSDGPPPGAYDPKVNIADFIPKENKAGPFGDNTERFKEYKSAAYPPSKDNVIAAEIDREYNEMNPASRVESPSSRFRNRKRGFSQSVFTQVPQINRTKDKPIDGPPPNIYNCAPSWDLGTAMMKPAVIDTISKFQRDLLQRKSTEKVQGPGPAAYLLPSSVKLANPAKVGVSMGTAARDGPVDKFKAKLPAPGSYDVATRIGSKSFNIMLTER